MALPTRLQEEIAIYNLSLPGLPSTSLSQHMHYEPEQADLLRAAECPICRSTPTLPIYNCKNGHFACGTCRPRLPLQKCPFCSANFTKMRNYPLENIVSARVFICDFRSAGCKIKNLTMMEYENHMRDCWFRSLSNASVDSTRTCSRSLGFSHENENIVNSVKCASCGYANSTRKLKCQSCQSNLRVPTPTCGRSPLRSITENEMRYCSQKL